MATTAMTMNDIEGHSQFAGMQSVEHLCNILQDFSWHSACMVPLH